MSARNMSGSHILLQYENRESIIDTCYVENLYTVGFLTRGSNQ